MPRRRAAVGLLLLLLACSDDADGGDGSPAPADATVCDGGAVASSVCPGPADHPDARADAGMDASAMDGGDAGADLAPDAASDAAADAGTGCESAVCPVDPRVAEEEQLLPGCTYASPVAYERGSETEVLVIAGETLWAFSTDGAWQWRLALPAPDGEQAFGVATPVRIGDRLVASYHTVLRTSEPHDVNRARIRHRVAVIDLAGGRVDPEFEPLDVTAEFAANDGDVVAFAPANALGRAALVHLGADDGLGRVYVAFGNARDIQPWHGFLFEVDLDTWRAEGAAAAISAQFLSTPEAACGTPGMSGSRTRQCGGGMWSPSGPLLVERAGGAELFVSTGNGQLDVTRSDFANSVLRFRPGLQFDPGCDAEACADFDSDAPGLPCVESCRDLFIPRLSPGDPFPTPESGACDGLTLFECWEELDYVGGSSPVSVKLASGTEVLAYPAKDGALYLFDADHLGTMYDREQLVAVCGTESDECTIDWAGMIVTQPAVTELDGEPLLLVPTFMPDRTHPAGVVAVAIHEADGKPELRVRWQAPSFDAAAALQRFRRHPSRIRLSHDGRLAWLVEAAPLNGQGRLLGIRVADGTIVVDEPLRGPGYRFTQPLLVGERLFVPSCQPDNGPSRLEVFDIGAAALR